MMVCCSWSRVGGACCMSWCTVGSEWWLTAFDGDGDGDGEW